MADVITRFKLETTQYDSKLRDAAKGLKEVVKQAELAGKDFKGFEKNTIEAAKALGTIETGANNSKDKVKELVGAFNEMAKTYNTMSKDIREGDIGKALAESLTQLSGRIKKAKQELYSLGDSANGGGLFSGLGDKMSGAIQVFAGNMMTNAAGAVANLGSEMYGMVQQGIELAKQGEGIRIAFERLGRGDILDGLREATHGTVTDLELMKAAVKFSDFKLPVEELGTMLAFAQQKAKDTGQSIDYMVDSIVTGLGRKSLMILDNLGLSAAEIKEKMKETGDMTKAVGEIIREQMSKAGDYVETAADRATQATVSLQNKMEELGRKFGPLQEASNNLWTSMKIGILDIIGGPLTDFINKLTEAGRIANAYGILGGNAKVGRMTANLANAKEENRQSIYQQQQQEIWRYINRRENYMKDRQRWINNQGDEGLRQRLLSEQSAFGTNNVGEIQAQISAAKKMLADYQQAAKTLLNPIDAITSTTTGTKKTSGRKKVGVTGNISEKVRTNWDRENLRAIALSNTLKAPEETSSGSELWKIMTQGAEESTNQIESLTAAFERLNDVEGVTLKSTVKESKKVEKSFDYAAEAVSSIGSALSQIEDPAAKVVGTIAQAVASVALGYSQATVAAAQTGNPYVWAAFAAAGLAQMLSMIATIHSATGYARGGEVKGNSFSGDNIPIMANAGEVVLTRAMANTLASSITDMESLSNLSWTIRMKGEDIYLTADRSQIRRGRGRILTSKG